MAMINVSSNNAGEGHEVEAVPQRSRTRGGNHGSHDGGPGLIPKWMGVLGLSRRRRMALDLAKLACVDETWLPGSASPQAASLDLTGEITIGDHCRRRHQHHILDWRVAEHIWILRGTNVGRLWTRLTAETRQSGRRRAGDLSAPHRRRMGLARGPKCGRDLPPCLDPLSHPAPHKDYANTVISIHRMQAALISV